MGKKVISTKYAVDDKVFIIGENNLAVEDVVVEIKVKVTNEETVIVYELAKSGKMKEEGIFPNKREIAVHLGYVQRKVMKKKDVAPSNVYISNELNNDTDESEKTSG